MLFSMVASFWGKMFNCAIMFALTDALASRLAGKIIPMPFPEAMSQFFQTLRHGRGGGVGSQQLHPAKQVEKSHSP